MQANLERAYALLERGIAHDAEAHARQALRDAPDSIPWRSLLALALGQQGRHADAEEVFADLTRLQPRDASHWLNLGNAALANGRPEVSLAAFEQAGALGASGIEGELGCGLALQALGRHAQAEAFLRAALQREPQAPDVILPYAQVLCELERFTEALDQVRRIPSVPLDPSQRFVRAWVLMQAGDDAAAEAAWRDEIAAAADHVDARLQYALLLERLNRVDEAAAVLDHPAVAGSDASTVKSLAHARVLRRSRRADQALPWLDAGLSVCGDTASRTSLRFEQARCFEALDQVDAAIAALAQAHEAATQTLEARFPGARAGHALRWLDERLSRPAPESWRRPIADGAPADPVFLIGFPRSGTTLLESVLDGHPALTPLDERPALEEAIVSVRAAGVASPDDLDRLDAVALSGVRSTYWREVARHLGAVPSVRLLDKYPLYLARLPYIARLFPQAQAIALLRHPCDCVLSCYMQSFGFGGGVLSFATLEATAQTYADVMSQWEEQRLLAGVPTHVLRYEDLVDDFEGELRRVLAFLGLPWDASMTRHDERMRQRERRVRTPSYSQVIEPVNRRAVGRWLRYRAHFSDRALALLEPFVQRYGYTMG